MAKIFFLIQLPCMAKFRKVLLDRKGWERRAQFPQKREGRKVGKDSRIAANRTRIQEAGPFLSGGLKGSEGGICKFDTSPDTWHQCGPEAPTACAYLLA